MSRQTQLFRQTQISESKNTPPPPTALYLIVALHGSGTALYCRCAACASLVTARSLHTKVAVHTVWSVKLYAIPSVLRANVSADGTWSAFGSSTGLLRLNVTTRTAAIVHILSEFLDGYPSRGMTATRQRNQRLSRDKSAVDRLHPSRGKSTVVLTNPFRSAVPFWAQTTQIPSTFVPDTDCSHNSKLEVGRSLRTCCCTYAPTPLLRR